MRTTNDNHPRLTSITAAISLIAAGLGAMYIMLYFGLPQDWFIMLAPISSVVIAGVFLYHGRDKFRTTRAPDELQTPVVAADTPLQTPGSAVNNLIQKLESKIEQQGMIVTAGAPQVIAVEAPAENSVTVVDRSKQQIEKKRDLRCLIITAPSHGVLQDRLNNWLSGGYGLVVSTSMAVNGKGFYLTVFYEPLDSEQGETGVS